MSIKKITFSHGIPNVLGLRFLTLLSANNISVISWLSVLLVEETGVPVENHRPVTSH